MIDTLMTVAVGLLVWMLIVVSFGVTFDVYRHWKDGR